MNVPSVGVEPTLGALEAGYFFLYPTGHFGFMAVTFLVVLPLTQVMVVTFDLAVGVFWGESVACVLLGLVELGTNNLIFIVPAL